MTDEQRLERNGCCAHLKVLWATEEVDGLTRGWWECSDCHSKFIPERAALAQLDAARQQLDSTIKDAAAWSVLLAASEQQLDAVRQQLGNLLAIIHRDGGHRQSAVGTDQAVEEAHQIWATLIASEQQVKRLRKALRELQHKTAGVDDFDAHFSSMEDGTEYAISYGATLHTAVRFITSAALADGAQA